MAHTSCAPGPVVGRGQAAVPWDRNPPLSLESDGTGSGQEARQGWGPGREGAGAESLRRCCRASGETGGGEGRAKVQRPRQEGHGVLRGGGGAGSLTAGGTPKASLRKRREGVQSSETGALKRGGEESRTGRHGDTDRKRKRRWPRQLGATLVRSGPACSLPVSLPEGRGHVGPQQGTRAGPSLLSSPRGDTEAPSRVEEPSWQGLSLPHSGSRALTEGDGRSGRSRDSAPAVTRALCREPEFSAKTRLPGKHAAFPWPLRTCSPPCTRQLEDRRPTRVTVCSGPTKDQAPGRGQSPRHLSALGERAASHSPPSP